jgi:hypothetical protein
MKVCEAGEHTFAAGHSFNNPLPNDAKNTQLETVPWPRNLVIGATAFIPLISSMPTDKWRQPKCVEFAHGGGVLHNLH